MTTWDTGNAGTGLTFSNGNRTVTAASTSGTWLAVLANTSKSTGKAYWEILLGPLPNDGSVNGGNIQIGFAKNDQTVNGYIGQTGNDGWVRADMATYDGGAEGVVSYTTGNRGYTSAVANDVIGFAIDCDAGKLWVAKNNTFGGNPGAGTNPAFTWTPGGNWYPIWACFNGGYSADPSATLRTAVPDQSYTAPSGFTAWDAGGGGSVATVRAPQRRYIRR